MVASNHSLACLATDYLTLSNGYTVEYVATGEGDPLVLVPGLAGGIGLLEPLINELRRDYRVIAYQLRGEGRGLFDRSFGFRQLVDDLDELISALKLERPALAGLSFGGAIALDYATRCANRLSFVMVQGAAKDFRPGLITDVARAVLGRLPLPDDNPFINQFFNVLTGGPRRPNDRLDFIVNRCWRTDQSMMAHRLALLDDYDLESRLDKVAVPTLVVGADLDVLVHAQESKELARRIPRGRYEELAGAGHLAFVTHPELLASSIRQFRQRLD